MKQVSLGEAATAAGLCVYALIPFIMPTQAWLGLFINTMLIAVLGIAWNITGGFAGQISFGHAALFGTGAFATAMLQIHLGWNAWLAAAVAIVAGAAMGGFIGALAFRYGLRGSYFALLTLAFAEVLRILASSFDVTGGGAGLQVPLEPGLGNLQFAQRIDSYAFVLALLVLALAVSIAVRRSRFGAYLIAVRENEEAAKALGINTFRMKVLAMMLAGAIGAAAGMAYVQIYLFINAPIAYGVVMSIEALLGPIIGGAGTILGPVVGTVVLHAVGELVKEIIGGAPGLSLVFYGIVLLLILRFLPDGLMGLARRLPWPNGRGKTVPREAG